MNWQNNFGDHNDAIESSFSTVLLIFINFLKDFEALLTNNCDPLWVKNIHIQLQQCVDVMKRPACRLKASDRTETYITPQNETRIAFAEASGNDAASTEISVRQHRRQDRGGPRCSAETVSVFHPGSQSAAGGESEKVTLFTQMIFPKKCCIWPPPPLHFSLNLKL